jgi:hypothetical protein
MTEKLKITKVRHMLRTKDSCFHCNTDLIFIDGQPAIVLEWLDFSATATVPGISVPLDPKYLHAISGWGDVTHMYQVEVLDPRS